MSFVSKHIYIRVSLNRKLRSMGKQQGVTQQELIHDILEREADKWQKEDSEKLFDESL